MTGKQRSWDGALREIRVGMVGKKEKRKEKMVNEDQKCKEDGESTQLLLSIFRHIYLLIERNFTNVIKGKLCHRKLSLLQY